MQTVDKKKRKILFNALALAGILVLGAAGCEKQTKHEILTFFFTGVPPLEGEQEMKEDAKGGAKRKEERPPPIFIHGPRAAEECFYCHDTSSTLSFGKTGKKGTMPRLGELAPGRLVLPMKELCVQCHTSKSAELIFNRNLWVHGPLANGLCTNCHDYHETRFRYMLLYESTIDLCTQCHTEGFITDIEEHKRGEECIACHNPHMGANRLLLRKDYNEFF